MKSVIKETKQKVSKHFKPLFPFLTKSRRHRSPSFLKAVCAVIFFKINKQTARSRGMHLWWLWNICEMHFAQMLTHFRRLAARRRLLSFFLRRRRVECLTVGLVADRQDWVVDGNGRVKRPSSEKVCGKIRAIRCSGERDGGRGFSFDVHNAFAVFLSLPVLVLLFNI